MFGFAKSLDSSLKAPLNNDLLQDPRLAKFFDTKKNVNKRAKCLSKFTGQFKLKDLLCKICMLVIIPFASVMMILQLCCIHSPCIYFLSLIYRSSVIHKTDILDPCMYQHASPFHTH
jgi:hypothetical protein